MPPKKPTVDPAAPSSSNAAPAEEAPEKTAENAVAVRKLSTHPSTVIMVRDALKALDSRKGVSSQAIQGYIKQKYPSVDLVRLKHLVRRTLKKGMENGTLVRPVNASVTTGVMGKFRLAPNVREAKPKSENKDPNVQKAPKASKDAAKKSQKAAATEKSANEKAKSAENPKPPKTSKKDKAAAPLKVPPAKKPKEKLARAKESADGGSDSTKAKATKTKGATAEKKPPRKAANASTDAPASKAVGKRGKKTESN